MPKFDHFESQFKSAVKEKFSFKNFQINKILLIIDSSKTVEETLTQKLKGFLRPILSEDNPQFLSFREQKFNCFQELLDTTLAAKPDLIVTHRKYGEKKEDMGNLFSLGLNLDSLILGTPFPILVLPDNFEDLPEEVCDNTNSVTVVADHITGDNRLINYGIKFSQENGTLFVTHIEDSLQMDRIFKTIEKIPDIDTETAKIEIEKKLLGVAEDYIASIQFWCEENKFPLNIKSVVKCGHALTDYKTHLSTHKVDLLIFNANNHGQLAMNGMAYSLTVELKNLPLLLL